MRVPDNTIEDIRRASDIVEVLSPYVHLKKRGKNYIGLCPFHKEKTPSFTVSAEKQMYHCFGCSKGGNVFTFVMEVEKVSFIEAVRSLAARAGIVISEESRSSAEASTETENLYAVCRFAGLYFFENLTKNDEGKSALEYFHNRGFTDETIRTFGLGYSMNSWDGFVQRAIGEGFKAEDILAAGLARKRDDGSLYDYFRGRAMFPIFSTTGRVIGFGARKMREDDAIAGKYINSPETPIYNKSRVLFGLSLAKDAIRQEDMALMVEGYADLISLYQAGIQNVVASSGTALTEEQLNIISRYSRNLTLIYDGDSAGSHATVRGIDLALEHDLNVRIVELPADEDPDSFVQKNGGIAFRSLITLAISFIDFKARQFERSGSFATPEGKTAAVRDLMQSVAKIKDEIKRNFYIKDIAEKYDVYENLLYRELEKHTVHEPQGFHRQAQRFPAPRNIPEEPVQAAAAPPGQTIPAEEKDLLKVFLEGNLDVIRFVLSHISIGQLSDQRIKTLLQLIVDRYDENNNVDANSMLDTLEDSELRNIVSDVILSKYELSPQWLKMEKEIDDPNPLKIARDSIVALQKKQLQRDFEENRHALKEAQNAKKDVLPYQRREEELKSIMRDLNSSEYLKVTP